MPLNKDIPAIQESATRPAAGTPPVLARLAVGQIDGSTFRLEIGPPPAENGRRRTIDTPRLSDNSRSPIALGRRDDPPAAADEDLHDENPAPWGSKYLVA
jgi:hypothetical protein